MSKRNIIPPWGDQEDYGDTNDAKLVKALMKGEKISPEEYGRALEVQVGGDHYKKLPSQPVEFCQRNGFRTCEANVIKYISRYHVTRNMVDLDKAEHYIKLIKELDNVS